MKIATIVGSIRQESINKKLALYMKKRYQDRLDIELLDIAELPYYNQDIEFEPPEVVVQFKQQIKDADAILWVTPEYNHSIPGVMKNAIDWLSRVDQVVKGKPSWIVGASPGMMGSVRAQLHMRTILFAPGISSPLLPGNEVIVTQAHQKFDEAGNLIDESTIAILDSVVNNFIEWMEARK